MNLVIIGGGNNGHVRSDGVKTPYEQKEIDDYISTLTNDKKLLFILAVEILISCYLNGMNITLINCFLVI